MMDDFWEDTLYLIILLAIALVFAGCFAAFCEWLWPVHHPSTIIVRTVVGACK